MKRRISKALAVVAAATLLALLLAACGGDEEPEADATTPPQPTPTATAPAPADTAVPEPADTPVPAPADTPAPEPEDTPVPAPANTPEPPAPSPEEALAAYAAEHAGGPGAIFVGDPTQLVGPPPHPGLMFQATEAQYLQALTASIVGLPSMGISSHMFIYTSDYYQGLIEKARLTNPTPLTSSGESIEIQHACITRTLATCVIVQAYLAPNLAQRTNGQVQLTVTSFPELGLAGPETLQQVGDGTLDMANIYTGYVAGAVPALEVQSLWGTSQDWETTYSILTELAPDVDRIILESSGGSPVINRNWFAGSDQWFYGNKPLLSVADFEGIKIRSHSASMSDFITGLGAEPVFLGPGQSYTAIEIGQVDATTLGILLSLSDRIYEVTDYLAGPIIAFGYTNNVINKDIWNDIPEDIQQIIIEEGAKAELEALRLAPFDNLYAMQANLALGMTPVPFSEEILDHIDNVVLPEHILPGWIKRLGYPDRNADVVATFNEVISPYVGYSFNEDGSIAEVPITKGSRAR